MDSDLRAFVASGRWIPFAGALVHLAIRALKSERVPPWLARIPVAWRPRLAVLLGALLGALDHVVGGQPWLSAIGGGLAAGALAIAAHELGIESLRDGREIGEPKDEGPPPTPRDPSVLRPGGLP